MKKRQLLYLVVLVLAVGLLGAWVETSRQQRLKTEHATIGVNVLPGFPLNDVERLVVTDKAGSLEVAKKGGVWKVTQRYDYPADFGDVSTLLKDVADLKTTQTVEVGESQYGRLDLLTPAKDVDKSGTDVQFFAAADKAVPGLRLGKEHKKQSEGGGDNMMGMGGMGGMGGGSWPDGRYVLLPTTKTVVLVPKSFTSVTTKPQDWIDKEFFKISDMKSAKLESGGTVVYEAVREKKGEDMKLLGLAAGEEKDDAKVRSISNAFSYASFEDVMDPKAPAEETGLNAPKVFTATDFDGFTYTVRIGTKTADDKYPIAVEAAYNGPAEREKKDGESEEDAKKADEEFKKKQDENRKKAEDLRSRLSGWTYLVTKYTVDDVVKERQDLLKKPEEKKADAAPAPAVGTPPPPPPAPAEATPKADAAPKADAGAAAAAAVQAVGQAVQQAAGQAVGAAAQKLDELKTGADKAEAAKPEVKAP